MSFKSAVKEVVTDTIKIGGCMGILVVSGGFVALKAYRHGYLDAYNQATALIDDTIERELSKMENESRQKQAVL